MNSNVTYQLIGDRAIMTKCESRCTGPKITINFINAEPSSHLVVGEGVNLRIVPITDGRCVLDLSVINSDVINMRVSKTVSPLKSWRCDELIAVRNQDGQYRLFPDAAKVLEAISKLRIFKKEATFKYQDLEKRIKKIEGEVTRIVGGYITE